VPAAVLVLAALVVYSLDDLGFFDQERLARAGENFVRYAPEFVPAPLDDHFQTLLWDAIRETLQMAFLGTLLGALIGLPLAVLAARPLTGPVVSRGVRLFLAFVRTVPSLVWALFFIILFGLGPIPGVLGITLYTVGFVGKLYYESLEGLDPDVLEAVRATGATRFQLVRHAAIPEAANAAVSHILYAFEYNIRASSVLGFVGAGGIGLLLDHYKGLLDYHRLVTTILVLFALVVAIDAASRFIRKRYLLQAETAAGAS